MKINLLLISLLAACSMPKAKTLRLGDVVQFKFSERNLFYSDICEDKGEVVDRHVYSENTRYLIEIRCKNQSYPKTLWIDAEDLVKVLSLGKDKYGDSQQ